MTTKTETQPEVATGKASAEPKTVTTQASNTSPRVVRTIPVATLNIDHSYQRPATKKMEAIGGAWNDSLVGYPVLSQREDGSYWIIDGQHRLGGARLAGKQNIECDVRSGLTLEEEAKLFDELNGQRSHVQAIDRYKARLFYNDPAAVEITQIVNEFDGGIATKSDRWDAMNDKTMAVRSVASLFRLYEQEGPARLREILSLIKESWGAVDYQTTNELSLSGINILLNSKKKYDRDRLVRRMNEEGVAQIKRMAHAHSQIFGGSGPKNFYRAIIESYNRHLPQRQRISP